MRERTRHHLIHSQRQWSAEPIGQALRSQPSLIFRIRSETHNLLHDETPAVPLLGYHALRGTFQRYEPTHDATKDIDGLCLAIDRTVRGQRFHPLERDLAGLAIEAIQLQRPYIMDGLVR